MANKEKKRSGSESPKALDLFLRSRFTYILIFLCTSLVYNLNFREVSELDTFATCFLPVSILKEFNLDLDEFFILHKGKKEESELPYYIRYNREKGHYYSRYPPLSALFALPVYVLPVYAGWLDEEEPDYAYDVSFVSKIAASLLASLSAVFFFAAVKLVTRVRLAIITTGVYAFATSVWSVASQGLWEHTPAVFCLSVGLYFLLRSQKELTRLIYASLFFSLAVAVRPSNIFLLLAAWVYVLFSRPGRRKILIFSLIPLVIGALIIPLNLKTTGSIVGSYGRIDERPLKTHGVKSTWQAPSGVAFLGLLLSPNRGLFIYSPVLIFSLLGMAGVWRKRAVPSGPCGSAIQDARMVGRQERWLLRYLSVGVWATVVLYSAYGVWWGGWSFGPRYMTDLLPFFSLYLGVGLEGLVHGRPTADGRKSTFLWGLFAVALFYSAFVQGIGFLAYPSGWNYSPDNVDLKHERLWDFADTQIIRCIKAGKRPSILADKSFAHTERALKFFSEKRYNEAIAHNQEAIRLYGKNAYAHNNLASIYFTLGRYDEALEEYNKALKINQNIFVAWKNLAIIYHHKGEATAARRALANAFLLQPENTEVRRMLEELKEPAEE